MQMVTIGGKIRDRLDWKENLQVLLRLDFRLENSTAPKLRLVDRWICVECRLFTTASVRFETSSVPMRVVMTAQEA